MEAQPLVQAPHQQHDAVEKVKCAYIEILQVAETYEHISSKIRMLNEILPATLKTVGAGYVFADYLKDWTSQKGVPLPLP
jgi:hypothetical protein